MTMPNKLSLKILTRSWSSGVMTTIHVTKTKELVMDGRRSMTTMDPIIFKGEPVEMLNSYKCL